MAGGTLLEKIDTILDEVEDRLKNDGRMPQGGDSTALNISAPDVRRGERLEAIPDRYPVVYIVHGEIAEEDATTRDNEFTFTIWLETYIRERDPEVAVDLIKKYVTQERRLFRESPDDKRLVDDNGDAIVLGTQTPSMDYGQFRPIGDADEFEFGGLVQLEFIFHLTD